MTEIPCENKVIISYQVARFFDGGGEGEEEGVRLSSVRAMS